MQFNSHQPISFIDLSISYEYKQCFDNFSNTLYCGEKIGIIGRNGSGKTSLLKILAQVLNAFDGEVKIPDDVLSSYVPQLISEGDLSGGQIFNLAFSKALSSQPNLLLLDEPTNHLDRHNRLGLMGMLKRYTGTLIVVTHDTELLRNCVDILWHVANNKVTVFNGKYDEYIELQKQQHQGLLDKVKELNYEKRQAHEKLMQEQHRAKNAKLRGEKHIKERKWPTVGSVAKMSRSVTNSVDSQQRIRSNKQNTVKQLEQIFIPEVISPRFYLDAKVLSSGRAILNITNGNCGYLATPFIINNINITLSSIEKAVILGNNASGKSTLFKAILEKANIIRGGEWLCPSIQDIGYLDQHYLQLDPDKTAVELVDGTVLTWSYAEIRNHLNSFLLRKNEEVNLRVKYLSGGEKVRLSLALIAANPPKLLLLDEITNNIDLETKDHLIQVLKEYPGSFILICHDSDFIKSLIIDKFYKIENGIFSNKLAQ